VPVDHEPGARGDLADHRGQNVPLAAHREERVDVLRAHHGAHALLRLAGQDLRGRHPGGAQRHGVQVDVHAAVTGARQLGGGARQSGAAQVLDAHDEARVEQLEAALDEHLLGERVTHLHRRELLAPGLLTEGLRRQHRHPADAVETRARAEQDDLVAGAGREGQVQVLGAHRTHAQRVDQRVAQVALIEDDLAADVGQAERVAVPADARDDAGQDPRGVGCVGRAEPQRVGHRDRPGPHRHDVADDPADTGGGTLVRLDVGRVVVRFHLERHGPAVADVDDAGVLADAGEHPLPHGVGGGLAEVGQVHLGRLVGAVLAPHHRVHRQLGVGRPAPEDLPDPRVLVVLQPQFAVGLGVVGRGGGVVDRVSGLDSWCHGWSAYVSTGGAQRSAVHCGSMPAVAASGASRVHTYSFLSFAPSPAKTPERNG
jgi:hypothetical protein